MPSIAFRRSISPRQFLFYLKRLISCLLNQSDDGWHGHCSYSVHLDQVAGLVIGQIYLALIDPLDVLVYLLLQSLPLNIIHAIINQHR